MQSVEVLEKQIESFEDLRSIVRTMKALSAVSIHQYERAVDSLSDYTHTVELGLSVVLQRLRRFPPEVRAVRDARVALIVFGSDHGLCGRFNEDIVDYAVQALNQDPGRAAVQDILVTIDDWRTQYGVEDVRLYYNRHLSSVGYRAEERRILPFDPEPFRSLQQKRWPSPPRRP